MTERDNDNNNLSNYRLLMMENKITLCRELPCVCRAIDKSLEIIISYSKEVPIKI